MKRILAVLAAGSAVAAVSLLAGDGGQQQQQEQRRAGASQASTHPIDLDSLYRTLSISGRKIRVLILKPGDYFDAVDCSMKVVNLDDAIYEALSYTWRAPPNTKEVKVFGINIKVRDNLYWALNYLRQPRGGQPRTVWVDAICINQAKDGVGEAERDMQIPLMGDIYRNAKKVVVWLGLPGIDVSIPNIRRCICSLFVYFSTCDSKG